MQINFSVLLSRLGFYHNLFCFFFMNCLKPYYSKKDNRYYPCGRCLTCRIQRREEWTLRMMKELEYWNDACFVTLTYDDNHLPANSSLCKSDLQDFFKRLRRNISRRISPDYRIKYFACGEYGSENHRPHYHAIIFGLNYANKDHCKLIQDSWQLCAPHIWFPRMQHGRMRYAIGPARMETIRYVTGYVYKKAVDSKTDSYLACVKERTGVEMERVFQTQSQGIGLRWCMENSDAVRMHGYILCHGRKPVPRYFRKKLGIFSWNNIAFQEVCNNQKKILNELSAKDDKNRRQWILCNPLTKMRTLDAYRKKLAISLGYDSWNHYLEHECALRKMEQCGEDLRDFTPLPSEPVKYCYEGDDCFILNNIDFDSQRLKSYGVQRL